jgi:uncharacterized protein DUF4440
VGDPLGVKAANVDVVRQLWSALRERRPELIEALLSDDVVWHPALLATEPLCGRGAVREQLERITARSAVADSQPFSFEPVGRSCVLVSGALRLRRPDGGLTTHLRWWVYVLREGRIAYAANHESRETALAAARELSGRVG